MEGAVRHSSQESPHIAPITVLTTRVAETQPATGLAIHVSTPCTGRRVVAFFISSLATNLPISLYFIAALRGVRPGYPEQRQGEGPGKAPVDADRDHGRGGARENGKEGG
jgi:hypothetical protein